MFIEDESSVLQYIYIYIPIFFIEPQTDIIQTLTIVDEKKTNFYLSMLTRTVSKRASPSNDV